ncbi:amino acid adenylation domain-containing protein [Deinococcus sp. HMF7604]|uniref:non-ribosomal peptide synthetase n=1 Tax=Deinococcus betulae TaxID=2873312 RepID=UPI001CCF05CB|nr:non-ribosomal peptide synthetase [Deinococcus betulae]MBZ9752278.1 amino acid adenylation domain-containing protein [Deinococcus betulae]
MQSIETNGQLRVAAAQRPQARAYWTAVFATPWERSAFPSEPHLTSSTTNEIFSLPAELDVQLQRVSRSDPDALHALLAAGVAALLYRYTGHADLVIGQPLRPAGPGDVPSTFQDAVPLRFQADDTLTFRQWLEQARQVTVAAAQHQDYPVAVHRDPAEPDQAAPLFDVVIGTEGLHRPTPAAGLHLTFVPQTRALQIGGPVSPQGAARLARHLFALLTGALAAPDAPLTEVTLVTPDDQTLLDAVNDTAAPYPAARRLDEQFTRQVQATPDVVAVVTDDGSLTYAQLDARATRLARTLQGRGVQPGSTVAIAARRSPEMLAGILAILKVGAAYLPVDPSYPDARITYLLEDSGATLLLTQQGVLQSALPPAVQVLHLDDPLSYSPDASALPVVGTARDVAYMIYTSGSTGAPKGVLVEHHSVMNRIAWMQRAYPLTPASVILQKTPTSFDVSVWELFWWFFVGARVCLLAPGGERDPELLVRTIETQGVTTLHFVPSMLQAFLTYVDATGAAGRLASLKQVFASGEALGEHHMRRFNALVHAVTGAVLVNLYGPTEATVDVTHQFCTPDLPGTVPIGRPIDNTRVYVVNGAGQVQPVGVPGELCLAGVGLARGYHRRPELTAERFIPLADAGEDRVYRTGDLVRLQDDGALAYLGRIDHQVKVRGYRIELGEVEAQLRCAPGVMDAVVLTRPGQDGQDVLCGYVVGDPDLDPSALRQQLAAALPDFMVPAHLTVLEAFPLTPNGKLDRRALPDPEHAAGVPYAAPETEQQAALAAIWQDVLGVERVGIHDNFFALGGNSIHFVTVLARARAHNLTFTFQQLFAHPTVAALCAHLAQAPHGPQEQHQAQPFELISEIDRARLPADLEDAYPLSMLQEGLIFQNELTFGTAQYHDIISYIIQAPIDLERFRDAARLLVQRNPIFRTSYHLTGFSQPLQLVHQELPLPLFTADLRGLSAEEQDAWYQQWLRDEKAHRFVWEDGGLVRLHLHVLGDGLCRYTLSQHNSALDGWSITLVHTQLFGFYHQLLSGDLVTAPAVDNHLRNYMGLERQALANPDSQAFWLSVLDGAPFTHLPRWSPEQDPGGALNVQFHDVHLPRALSDAILSLAERLNVPVKTVLMTAHLKVLSVLSGDSDVMTGYEHSGRPEVEGATQAIGLFLNTVPFRVSAAPGRWSDLIRRVYDAETALLPHRRYPMARMKQDFGTQDILFETAFNYTHFYLLKELKRLPEFALLDVRANSETEFVLRAEFSRHFFTDDVRLSLHFHDHVFTPAQVERMGGYYRRAFELMTADLNAEHGGASLIGEAERQALLISGAPILDTAGQLAPVGTPGRRPGHASRVRMLPGGALEAAPAEGRIFHRGTATAAVQGDHLPPATPTEQRIAAVWSDLLGVPYGSISATDNFFDLGGNSLAALRVALLLEGRVTLLDVMRHSQLSTLARVADEKAAATAQILHRVSAADLPVDRTLICVPYAGGNAINFQPLAQALQARGARVAVYAVDLADAQRAGPVDVPALAAQLRDVITREIQGPVLLWGHCVGSAVAVETARLLEEAGAEVERVFVAGKVLAGRAQTLSGVETMQAMSDADVLDYLVTATGYAELDGVAADVGATMVRRFRDDAVGANQYLATLSEHWADRSLRAPLTVVIAQDDPLTHTEFAPDAAWHTCASHVTLHTLERGGHYFCRTQPAQVAALIASTSAAAPAVLA